MHTYRNARIAVCLPISRPRRIRLSRAAERGVALIITLLLLALITVLSLGMVIAYSSQTLIGGYYRNYRGAFYAADSGLNIAREQVVAELQAAVPHTFAWPPVVATACGSSGVVSVGTTYASPTTLNTGIAGQSWAESFKITNATIGSAAHFHRRQHLFVCLSVQHYLRRDQRRAANSRPSPKRATSLWW